MKLDTSAIAEAIRKEMEGGDFQQSRFLREINNHVHPPARGDRFLLPFLNDAPLPTIEGVPFTSSVHYRTLHFVNGNLYFR